MNTLSDDFKPALLEGERAFPEISIRGLCKRFGADVIYGGFDLDIPRNQVTAFFGPNGCGKSTLMNMVAGLIRHDSGSILFDGREVKDVRIGYVFQNYREALFPWLRAIENIAYPLKVAGWPKQKIRSRLDELVNAFDLQFDLKRYPYQLSGGQQQLVSILRALAPDPEVIFLDEPFSALDFEMTLFVREKLQQLIVTTRKTLVVVSHDLEDAIYLSDQLVLLTRRPTRVAEVVNVPLPWPRDPVVVTEAPFARIKAHSLAVFQREVRKP